MSLTIFISKASDLMNKKKQISINYTIKTTPLDLVLSPT